MEKLSYSNSVAERPNNKSYELLRDEAPVHAEALIARVENFEKMDYREQLIELQSILDTLKEDNGNRFIAEYVAGKMYHIEIVAEETEVAERKERMDTPNAIETGYGGVARMVSDEFKQAQSPAANDQRAPTPALARAA